ncbi:hypothetical protein T484DRAFT_2930141 [Baffinella frigidus]|nr:hypothetical protein T484DRAFT_2930141 [Cryptophyta sp. CCMP2293]
MWAIGFASSLRPYMSSLGVAGILTGWLVACIPLCSVLADFGMSEAAQSTDCITSMGRADPDDDSTVGEPRTDDHVPVLHDRVGARLGRRSGLLSRRNPREQGGTPPPARLFRIRRAAFARAC